MSLLESNKKFESGRPIEQGSDKALISLKRGVTKPGQLRSTATNVRQNIAAIFADAKRPPGRGI